MSAPNLRYANMPYPYNLNGCSGQFDGDMRAGAGYLQPDKAGTFGANLVLLYKLTGNQRYLTAAIEIANTLTATISSCRCRPFALGISRQRRDWQASRGNQGRRARHGHVHIKLDADPAPVR